MAPPAQPSLFEKLAVAIPAAIRREPPPVPTPPPKAIPVKSGYGFSDLFGWANTAPPAKPSAAYQQTTPARPARPRQSRPQQPDLFSQPQPARRQPDEPLRQTDTRPLATPSTAQISSAPVAADLFQTTGGASSGLDRRPVPAAPEAVTDTADSRIRREPAATRAGNEDGKGNRDERLPASGRGDTEPVGRERSLPSGLRQVTVANILAIKTSKRILSENRLDISETERQVLSLYKGWGGVPQIFDEGKPEWAELRDELKSLTSDKEYAECRASTVNAHYTSPEIASAMLKFIERIGIKNGHEIIEPGCGKGTFLETLPASLNGVKFTGVELDSVTARIAKCLHGKNHEIRNESYADSPMHDSSYDAAIGNVPFGNFAVRDIKHNKNGHTIHNHFINKSLSLVKDNGFSVLLTSRYTLDSQSDAARREMAEKADLIAAVRLPETAFKKSANTDVVTDILIFRNRAHGQAPINNDWLSSAKTNVSGVDVNINKYFNDHPEHILGTLATTRGMHHRDELTVLPSGDTPLTEQLENVLVQIADKVQADGLAYNEAAEPIQAAEPVQATIRAPEAQVKEGAFTVRDGKLYLMDGGRLTTSHGVPENGIEQVKILCELRDTAREVLVQQRKHWDGSGASPWSAATERLNSLYDGFVAKYGHINKVQIRNLAPGADGEERVSRSYPNIKAFRTDPDLTFVQALESGSEDSLKKADIFSSRVVSPDRVRTKADSLSDAMLICLDEIGKLDTDRIAKLLSKDVEIVESSLLSEHLVFRDPKSKELVEASEYLSGNVRKKLRQAEKASQSDPLYQDNADALRKVQPEDLIPSQIDVALGASWIPASDIKDFMCETLDLYASNLEVSYLPTDGSWSVRQGKYGRSSVKSTVEFGTSRIDAVTLVSSCLNQKLVEVYDTHQDGSRTKNQTETMNAREKQELLQNCFQKWLWSDLDRSIRLAKAYNDKFNNTRLREYDGSHLTIPGLSKSIKLRKHQLDAVWRGLQGNMLAAIAVGGGKTLIGACLAMELKRTGIAKKPLIIVPGHMLEQWSREVQSAFPNARLLIATKEDFGGDARKRFVSRCSTGNYDAVILTHSTFTRIGVDKEFEKKFINEQCDELREMLNSSKKANDRLSIKEIEKSLKRREERLAKVLNTESKDRQVSFSELGIDHIINDESHLHKNLEFATKMTGINSSGSQRASDLFLKIKYLETIRPGKCVTFLSGTPITNSIAEMYTIQRYLDSAALKERNCQHFDSWAANFGRTVSQLELDPSGSNFRIQTRFAKFCNLPELNKMFRSFSTVLMANDLKLPVPQLKGGQAKIVTVPPAPELKSYIENLARRAERVKSRQVDPSTDNMLSITNDGKKAALDLRLVGIHSDYEQTKVSAATKEISRAYKENLNNVYTKPDGSEHPVRGGSVMVFCDMSTPNQDKWNVYNALREALVKDGIPRDAIKFIQDAAGDDAAKGRLFDLCRNKPTIIIGSTEMMGTGVNAQTRLCSLVHMDAPWRPDQIEQRDARLVRQGNQNKEVEIIRIVTTESFDTYMWQGLERKASFINQVLTGKLDSRECEDIDNSTLSFAEVKAIASGNPLLLEQANINAEVAKVNRMAENHQQTQWRLKGIRRNSQLELEKQNENFNLIERSIRMRDRPSHTNSITVGLVQYAERKDAGEAILRTANAEIVKSLSLGEKIASARGTSIGTYDGFPIRCDVGGYVGKNRAELVLMTSYPLTISTINLDEASDPSGLIRQISNRLQSLDTIKTRTEERIKELQTDIVNSERQLAVPFEHQQRLDAALQKQREIEELLRPKADPVAAEPVPDSPEILAERKRAFDSVLRHGAGLLGQMPDDKAASIAAHASVHADTLLEADTFDAAASKVKRTLEAWRQTQCAVTETVDHDLDQGRRMAM